MAESDVQRKGPEGLNVLGAAAMAAGGQDAQYALESSVDFDEAIAGLDEYEYSLAHAPAVHELLALENELRTMRGRVHSSNRTPSVSERAPAHVRSWS